MYNATTIQTDDGGGGKGKKPPLVQDESQKFGNWLDTADTKIMAKDLMDRGLIGADQIYFDNPNPNDPNSIRNTQGDWKLAAIRQILANAKKFNLRSPEAINANREVLIGNKKWADAIDNPYFNYIHPNFWSVITDSILPQRWKQYDETQKTIAKK